MPIDGLFHHIVIHHKSTSDVLDERFKDVKSESAVY